MHDLALRMNRNALLAEKRTRLLLAIRQTYNDFFRDDFISSGQVFTLRVRSSRQQPLADPPVRCVAWLWLSREQPFPVAAWTFAEP
jgi:hypothetical protein